MKDVARKFWRGIGSGESGFTLIEMLIVVGIIVALAAAIVPQVVSFGGRGEEGQKNSEKSTVQTAIDSAMADAQVSTITAVADTAPNKVWTAMPKKADGTTAIPIAGGTVDYLRGLTSTEWGYCYTAAGKVKQTALKDSTTCTD